MAVFTPLHRLLSVTTPLHDAAFLLTAFSGREEIGRGFRYELEMASDSDFAAVRALVGQEIAWHVRPPGAEPRWFHGVVSQLIAGGRSLQNLRTYRAVVVPRLFYEGRTVRCRIFEGKRVPEIVDEVLAGIGLTDHTWLQTGSCAPRSLCVQYREGDWQFVCRLLEEEGISLFFQHDESCHMAVLADEAALARAHDSDCEVAYGPGSTGIDRVTVWDRLMDGSPAGTEDATTETVTGASRCCSFTPGDRFTLKGHDFGEDGTYLLVAVEHAARDSSMTPHGGGREYINSFTCRPAAAPFRPPFSLPRPEIKGPRLAEVIAAAEQSPDGLSGRAVRVRFTAHGPERWEDGDTCLAHLPGAAAEGPHVGQEVILEFLDADPERPVIVGGALDSLRPAPDALTDDHGNELRFVAEEGRQLVRLRARADCRRIVQQDDAVSVGRHQSIEVQNDRTQTVREGNETIRLLKGNRTVTLDEGDETIRLEKGGRTLIVDGDVRCQVRKGNRELLVETGHEKQRILSGNREVNVEKGDDMLTLLTGNQTTRLEQGRSVTEAMHGIELRVGSSRIALEPGGIVIEGMAVHVRGHAETAVHGLMTQIGADGVLEVKGGATLVG